MFDPQIENLIADMVKENRIVQEARESANQAYAHWQNEVERVNLLETRGEITWEALHDITVRLGESQEDVLNKYYNLAIHDYLDRGVIESVEELEVV